MMNYLKELFEFHRKTGQEPMPALCQALWFRLMGHANAAHWPDTFCVSDKQLTKELMVCRKTLYKLRQTLCSRGMITFTPGKPGYAGVYQMHTLLSPEYTQGVEFGTHYIKQPIKHKKTLNYGYYQNIELSKEQYIALCEEFADAKERIESLSEYLHKTGKTYANHYELLKKHRVRKEKPAEDDWNPFLKMLKKLEETENDFVF